MADKKIVDFQTLEDAKDDDLILASSQDDTYNIRIGALKELTRKAGAAALEGAESAKAAAQSARAAAETARNEAQAALAGAVQSEQHAYDILNRNKEIAVRTPYVGGNGNWFVWNNSAGGYEDSGTKAQGVQGVQGIQGEKGDKGDKGDTGPQGIQGAQGEKGDTGPQGIQGDTGLAAGFGVPTAVVDSNVGTPSVTVTTGGDDTAKVFNFDFRNLKGETGAQGPKGDTGAKGDKGDKGDPGINGVTLSAAGLFGFSIDSDGHLILSYSGDEPPDLSINDDGHLIYTF